MHELYKPCVLIGFEYLSDLSTYRDAKLRLLNAENTPHKQSR
jgi:mannitol-1-phosphate/altronate dehydrogenase